MKSIGEDFVEGMRLDPMDAVRILIKAIR